MPTINLHDISITLNKKVCLDSINLTIEHEGISMIVGANGAGKTLLLKVIAGLLPINTGTLTSSGFTDQAQTIRQTWVPQTPVLLDRSVRENILLPLHHQSKSHSTILSSPKSIYTERVNQALAWADIEALGEENTYVLSTGQQQLVALARAWALSPQLLLLDEPCANLDPNRQQHIEKLIKQLSHQGCKIIMSSHQLSQAKRIASDIIFIDAGTLITHTSVVDFFSDQQKKNPKNMTPEARKKVHDFIQYT